jgi:dipeptidyl aminopeptidase/acylaminoacyl peptidase
MWRCFMKKCLFFIAVLAFILSPAARGEENKTLTFDRLMKIKRIGDPRFAPGGKSLAFVVSEAAMEENAFNSTIWVVDGDGKGLRQFTRGAGRDGNPQWSPDGRTLAFTSDRSGKSQIYLISFEGGEAWPLTRLSSGASSPLWSPDGRTIAFTSTVFYDCKDDEAQKKKMEEETKSKVKARVFDSLLYRHWDHFRDGKRSHLFVIPAVGGKERDLMAGFTGDVPPMALGGKKDFAFSPDSKEICYVANTDDPLTLSTNNDLFIIPVAGGTPRRITTSPANDNQPLYSPDGRYIAYRAMKIPGYEADRSRLMLYERSSGKLVNLTENLDRSVEEVFWAPDSRIVYFTAYDRGFSSLYRCTCPGASIEKVMDKSYNYSFSIASNGRLAFIRESSEMPANIFVSDAKGQGAHPLISVNHALIEGLALSPSEEFWFDGAGGTKVHGFIIRPPHFDASRKYPVLFLIHGGPQQMWGDTFGATWNPQMFTSRGYVVIKINPRGSEGYGQKFTDEINRDWGGKPYEDLMKGVDYVTARYPFIDSRRMAAAGASYGGYMANWIAGHTDRFKCLITIAGAYNLISKYGATDELWFPEWEMGGTPWTAREQYEKWSPHNFAGNFKTPTLVIHGQFDYRVPVTEGMQMFTALQRQNVPSRFLYFPDEGHWISRPQNLQLYFTTIQEWLKRWLN